MKPACITIAASLFWSGCSGAQPVPVDAGQSVSLRAGESARGNDLRFGFERVTADSRCPTGEQCVWAGDATVRVWLQRGAGPRQTRELHTANTVKGGSGAADRELRLLRLDPWPVAGTAIAPSDYVATLALTSGPTADPER